MKYVSFKELKIKNFLSIGEEPVHIEFNKGLHIVTGINRDKEDRRNGVGKSTIADALYFAIFGQTLRDLKKNFIANNLTAGTCEVQLSFTVDDPKHGLNEFDIIRTLNPSKVHVYKNGNDKTRDSIVNTNDYINAVLSSTPEIFQNCVIMTLNNHIPFMSKSKTEKRKFIEQIFNLEIFSKMLHELRNEHNEVKQNFDIEITKLDENNSYLNTQKDHRDNFNNDRDQKLSNLKLVLQGHKNDLIEAEEKVAKIKELDDQQYKDKLQQLENKLNQINDDKDKINHRIISQKQLIKTNAETLKKLGTEEDTCPVCLRPMEDHDHDRVEEEKKSIKEFLVKEKLNVENNLIKVEEFNQEISKINSAIKIVNEKITEIGNKKYSLSTVEEKIVYIKKCITEIEEETENTKNETNTFSNAVEELENKITDIKNEINNLKKVINLMDVVKFVVSEEGVKSFIVKKILSHFNSKLTYFLKKLDSNCVCVFNEYFEEEIVNEKGKICLYNNFSGAERKAIDLACLFSFMDMRKAQGDVYYNISFYDELFDSSLDEKGVDLVLEILNERVEKYNECVMVISHRKESIKSANGDIIFLEKHNGITRRINFVD